MTKPLSFHISNIKYNNINLSSNQIKRILQKVREIKYPLEQNFLNSFIYYFIFKKIYRIFFI